MLDHHLQQAIVYRLAFSPSLRFSELKPGEVENKLFDYHLKRVIASKLVIKQDDGTYALTAEGRRLGKRALDKRLASADRAESVLFLAVRRATDKAWLLYRRQTHPLLGRVGFMHALPVAGITPEERAAKICAEKTGITATFSVLGAGFFESYEGEALESFTNYTFLIANDGQGELRQNDEDAEYYWADDPDFTDANMLPNMKTLGNLHKANQLFFVTKSFQLKQQ